MLLTSELATNAVRHGEAPVSVHVLRDEAGVRVAVHDGGAGTPRFTGLPDLMSTGGRGMPIIDAMATSWGTDDTSLPGKAVWFRLDEV